jgi:hypothetical protein
MGQPQLSGRLGFAVELAFFDRAGRFLFVWLLVLI